MKKNYKLRPRKKVVIPQQNKNEKPAFVDKMTFLIEYKGVTKNYRVFFDEEPLTLKEMYDIGFIAEIQLPEPDGTMLNADIVASPAAKDEPQALGRFYFETNQRRTDISIPATVKKFHFTKKSTLF